MNLSKIPTDIIYNNIIPYLYKIQPYELLKDIKTFHYTLSKVFKMYYEVYEDHPNGKVGINLLLKIKINNFLLYNNENNNENYQDKIIKLYGKNINNLQSENEFICNRTVINLIRRMWGFINPVTRLKFMMTNYRTFLDN